MNSGVTDAVRFKSQDGGVDKRGQIDEYAIKTFFLIERS
jgi:hypothetical protein